MGWDGSVDGVGYGTVRYGWVGYGWVGYGTVGCVG